MDLGLEGLRALVTGGSRGIGNAIAQTLSGEGAAVAICARNAEGLNTAVAAHLVLTPAFDTADAHRFWQGAVYAPAPDSGIADV